MTDSGRELLQNILHAADQDAVLKLVGERGASIPKSWISGTTKADRALKLWEFVSIADDTYISYVSPEDGDSVPVPTMIWSRVKSCSAR